MKDVNKKEKQKQLEKKEQKYKNTNMYMCFIEFFWKLL